MTSVQPHPSIQPERLRSSEVCILIGVRKSKLYDMVRKGHFPQPIRMSSRSSRWPADVVRAWLETNR